MTCDFQVSPDSDCLPSVHWLPCAAPGSRGILPAKNAGNFFIVEEEADGPAASFQGRALRGKRLPWKGRVVGVSNFQEIILWAHDEIPLSSDSVPQALALARAQHILGSVSISRSDVDLQL